MRRALEPPRVGLEDADSGRVDDSLHTQRKVDFTPEVTRTAIATGSAGTMVARDVAPGPQAR